MTQVKIKRLEIRFKGVSPDTVRLCGDGLGEALLDRLARQPVFRDRSRSYSVGEVDAGRVRIQPGSDHGELRRTIAGRLGDMIMTNVKGHTE